jgi:hypothetical protein
LAVAALSVSVGAIARTARSGSGDDLIELLNARGVTRHSLDECRDQG